MSKEEKYCYNCYYFSENPFDRYGFCDEHEITKREDNYCTHWKSKEEGEEE